jgi:uncharacterized protein
MKDTLIYLLSQIVTHPEEVVVDEVEDADKTTLTIHVNEEDIGKVIGKQGRIIRSLRDLIKLIAAKHNTYVDVVLAE